MTPVNLEVAEKIYEELKRIPEVKQVNLLPSCGADLTLEVVISVPWSWKLSEKIADAISEAKWKIFEETGELPAVEWDVVEKE